MELLGGHGGGEVDVDLHIGAVALGVGVADLEREDHCRLVALHRQLVQLGDQPDVFLGTALVQRFLKLGLGLPAEKLPLAEQTIKNCRSPRSLNVSKVRISDL